MQYDFGKEGNLKKYGQDQPPEYETESLKELTIPISLYFSQKDSILSETDIRKLLNTLPSHSKVDYFEDYGHLDYIWADNTEEYYSQIAKLCK